MGAKYRKFSPEFSEQAARMVVEMSPLIRMSRGELWVNKTSLGNWVRAYRQNHTGDSPAPVSQWLPYLAECAGAKQPRQLPKWLARLLAGEMVVGMMTEGRGLSNAKAKRELGRAPVGRVLATSAA